MLKAGHRQDPAVEGNQAAGGAFFGSVCLVVHTQTCIMLTLAPPRPDCASAACFSCCVCVETALSPEVRSLLGPQADGLEVLTHDVTLDYSHLSADAVLKVWGV